MNMNFQKTINEFGAQPSESVLQTAFIQNALDACRDAGGGERSEERRVGKEC